ncbi:MAG: hypothetical protein M1148_03470 [Candidatus Thermoplasmatota archaeon]|nr:hypothetical protein [Candidatus Thermoplasmatota archaeon]
MEKEEKLTIRISEGDLLLIDEYLERNPQFGSRSEFIRKVVFNFIERSERTMSGETARNIRISPSMEDSISKAIERGFFVDSADAINSILTEAERQKVLLKIIQEKYEDKRAAEDIFADFDRNVRPYGTGSSSNPRIVRKRE